VIPDHHRFFQSTRAVFSKLKAAFAKKPASSTDDSAVAAPVAAEISSSTDDAVAAPSTVVDESFFALRRLNSSDSGSLSGTTAWRGDLALAQASAALDVVQEASAVAAIDGSVHVVTHTGASLRVLPPSGERVTLVYLLANAGLVAVGIGAALELIDFTDANAIKSVFKHEFAAAVTALAFTAGEAHLFVGLASGDVHVVVVAAQEGTAPFYVSAFVIDVVDTHSDCADDATRKVASRGKAAVTHIVPLPKANNVSLIIAYAESNVVVRYNITAQKTERLYSKRDGVGEKPLSCVAVHPNNDDVLCVHADGQFVLYNDKRNAPAVWFSVSGGDGADIGSGVSSLVWTTGADDEHIIALVRYDSDFKHSVVSVLTGERIDALRVAGELSAPKNVAYLSLALLTASPFEHQHATHALAVRDDGKFVAVALANGDSWQPSKLPSLWHVNRAPIAVAQVAQVSSTAMFIGDDAPEELTRDALWPGKRKSTIATSVSTADPALVMIAAQSDMSVSVFELASQQAVFHVDLSAALLAAKVSEPPRLSGVADCLAVSRAGRPLLLVSCIAGGEESEERCVLLFATSAPRGAPAAAGVAKVESDFGVFACQGVVARGPLARLERAHDAAIAVSCDATVTVFALDDKGALSQHTFQRPSDSVNAALLSNDSVALLLSNHAIVRVSNVIEDGTELRAASTDAEALRAPIKGFFALTSDASARFYGEQDVPRFLSCAGREVRLTTPEWLAADSALSLEERDFLTVDDTAAQCGGLVRRAWLVRGGENNSLYCVIYTAREQLQVFRASDLAPCATFPLDTVAQTDRKPVEIYLTCDGRGIVVTPLEAVAITVWANSKAPPDATAATSEAAPVRSDVGVFVPDAPLPERKSGLIGALFGTVKKNRNKALSVLSAPAAAASSSSSSSSAGAGGQHKAQGEVRSAASVMEHTKQRLLENQEKMQEVADKSADLADQSANFASLAAQLNQESQKKSFFGF
jgi:hypothetical protein